jgi:signal transduction histidine kinase
MVGFGAKKKGLKLETIIDPGLPEQICADIYWLKQILYNLVNNAVKFTHEGSVTIRLLMHGEGQWAMQVSDSGMGIPDKVRSAIFEPFRRGDKADLIEGSGLGLSIVSQLTALMKGKIELETEVGQGSTFTVILPLLEM